MRCSVTNSYKRGVRKEDFNILGDHAGNTASNELTNRVDVLGITVALEICQGLLGGFISPKL